MKGNKYAYGYIMRENYMKKMGIIVIECEKVAF